MTDPTRCPDHPPASPFDGMSLPDLCRTMPLVTADPRNALRFDTEAEADRAADAFMASVGGRGDIETIRIGDDACAVWFVEWTARTGRTFVLRRPIGGDR